MARKTSAYDRESFLRTFTIGAHAVPPPAVFAAPCVLGIDEAGRGPVSGPMVYGICYSPLSRADDLKATGFDDSKVLTEEKRDELFDMISKCDWIGWTATVLQPQDISAGMLRKEKYNLNDMSHNAAMELVQDALDRGVNVEEIYVDTVGDPDKYERKLKERFPGVRRITVSKKADSLFPIVSAASICAKVTRDRVLRDWQFEERNLDVDRDFGSGYPHDAVTGAWLKKHFNKIFGFPSIVRFSWSTAARIIESDGVRVDWGDAPDNSNVPTLFEFFGPSAAAAASKRASDALVGNTAAKRAKPTAQTSIAVALKLEPVHDF